MNGLKKCMKFGAGWVTYVAYIVQSMRKQFQECISCCGHTIKL